LEAHPQKILGAKNIKIWPDFGRLQISAVNISGTDEDIHTTIPPALDEKVQ